MTYKEFYAQAMLSSLPIAYAVEKDLVQGREPTPENVEAATRALNTVYVKVTKQVPWK